MLANSATASSGASVYTGASVIRRPAATTTLTSPNTADTPTSAPKAPHSRNSSRRRSTGSTSVVRGVTAERAAGSPPPAPRRPWPDGPARLRRRRRWLATPRPATGRSAPEDTQNDEGPTSRPAPVRTHAGGTRAGLPVVAAAAAAHVVVV